MNPEDTVASPPNVVFLKSLPTVAPLFVLYLSLFNNKELEMDSVKIFSDASRARWNRAGFVAFTAFQKIKIIIKRRSKGHMNDKGHLSLFKETILPLAI